MGLHELDEGGWSHVRCMVALLLAAFKGRASVAYGLDERCVAHAAVGGGDLGETEPWGQYWAGSLPARPATSPASAPLLVLTLVVVAPLTSRAAVPAGVPACLRAGVGDGLGPQAYPGVRPRTLASVQWKMGRTSKSTVFRLRETGLVHL